MDAGTAKKVVIGAVLVVIGLPVVFVLIIAGTVYVLMAKA
jgi:hypothetical protein